MRTVNERTGYLGLITLFATLSCSSCIGLSSLPTPPEQPKAGPGSSEKVATEIRTTAVGADAEKALIYEPAGITLETAPVIVFMHGYIGVNPKYYGAWIRHLVQRGNIVIFPMYQDSLIHTHEYTANAIAGIKRALAELHGGGHVTPDESRFAIVGHSLGCVIGLNVAAAAQAEGLPTVQALLAANAGDANNNSPHVPNIMTGDTNGISNEMLFLGVVGADDTFVGETATLAIYDALSQLPQTNREVLRLYSDAHGSPALKADHRAATSRDDAFDSGDNLIGSDGGDATGDARGAFTVDAIDYYGYWKWFDALSDAAFKNTNREYALGGGTNQTCVGAWSDGHSVKVAVRIQPSSE